MFLMFVVYFQIYLKHLTRYDKYFIQIKKNSILGNLLDTITEFLNSGKERVALNGQFSS